MNSGPAALYIHIPFCAKKCDYCDFYSIPVNDGGGGRLMDGFIEALAKDIEGQIKAFGAEALSSVYIGGGTPSLLGSRRMKELLDFLAAVLREYRRSPHEIAEFTVEVNPESLDEDFLRVCAEGGVTRISCGVQTFSEAARRAVGRGGGIGRLKSALSLLGEAYGGAFAADIICALPFQDEAALRFDMETLLSYSPVHVSLYDLTLEENTPLYRNVASSKIRLPRVEAAERLWIYGRDFLEARGYAQYEVSNFALPGKRSLHNGVYWRMGGWLGAGPSASGTLITGGGGSVGARGIRRLVRACVHGYVSSVEPEVSIEALDRDTLIKESFLMGFRCTDGPDVDLFRERFGRGLESFVPETLRVWRDAGKMRDGAQALNKDGLLMLNRFLTDCFAELDRTLGEI